MGGNYGEIYEEFFGSEGPEPAARPEQHVEQGRSAIRAAVPLNAMTMRLGRSLSRPVRAWLWQIVAAAAFAAFVLWLGHNARVNMAARNITFGFDFLLHPAGFDIPFHLLSWQLTDTYGYALLVCVAEHACCARRCRSCSPPRSAC